MLRPGVILVLASASPVRRSLLDGAGLAHEVVAAAVDEAAVKAAARARGMSAADTAVALAELKATRISGRRADAVVVGADQILVSEGRWFDKPEDPADQLRALRGRAHELVTAVVVLRAGCRLWHHVAVPRMVMRPFSDGFLDEYVAREGEALRGCVGGYRYEGLGVHLFDAAEGEQAAILGLPLLALLGFLRQSGVVRS